MNRIIFFSLLFLLSCSHAKKENNTSTKETTPITNNEQSDSLSNNTDNSTQEDTKEESYTAFKEGNVLLAGEFMSAGNQLSLEGEEVVINAKLTDDGLFFIYNPADRLWEAQPKAGKGATLRMQYDGQLVLLDANQTTIWSTPTSTSSGDQKFATPEWKPVKLVLEFSKLILYSATGRQVWTSEDATTIKIETFSEWPKNIGDLSCSCTFSPKDNDDAYLLISNYNDKAVIQIDGQSVVLEGGSVNFLPKLTKRIGLEHWIVLNEKGDDLLFGEKIDYKGAEDWQRMIRDELAKTLFIMDNYPEYLPMTTNGTVGMGHRSTFRDLYEDAKQDADLQKKYSPEQYYFENEDYECRIEASKVGKNDGGGAILEGNLIIDHKREDRQTGLLIKGECGC